MSRIIALVTFRDAAAYLPEFFQHLRGCVDGIIALDDRSTSHEGSVIAYDAGAKLIVRYDQDKTLFSCESRNRAILLREALAEGAGWVLCLDADERLEIGFLQSMRGYVDRCEQNRTPFSRWVRVRDLWDTPMQYRVDGIWCKKRKPVLFSMAGRGDIDMPDIQNNTLHRTWMLVHDPIIPLDSNLYHMGSLTPELRAERVRRHEAADPERKWQADYSYLAKEGPELQLERIPEGRNWY